MSKSGKSGNDKIQKKCNPKIVNLTSSWVVLPTKKRTQV